MGEQSKTFRLQFFKHYFNARQDDKLANLQLEEGMEGVGIYWSLLEQLGPISDHRSKCNYKSLSFLLHVDGDKIQRVVENYDLFIVKDGYFYSRSFSDQMRELNEKYERLAAAGSRGGRRKAEAQRSKSDATANNKQGCSDATTSPEHGYSDATATPEQGCSNKNNKNNEIYKIKETNKNKENNRDNTNRLVSSNESDDATKRFFDNRVSDNVFLNIVRMYMYKGASNPTHEAVGLINLFAPDWVTKDGRSFLGKEQDACQFWSVPRERKYIDRPRLMAADCRTVDVFLNILDEAGVRDVCVMDAYRGIHYDEEKQLLRLFIADRRYAKYIDDRYIERLTPVLKAHFAGLKSLEYNELKL